VLEGLLLEAENFLGVVTLVTQDLVVHTEMGVADVDDVRITRAVTELAEVVHADDLVLLGDHLVLLIDEDIVPLEICDGDLGRVFLRVELVLVENERDLPRAIAHLSVVVPRVAVVPARVDDLAIDFSGLDLPPCSEISFRTVCDLLQVIHRSSSMFGFG
jgi:hypothetical protein